MEETDIINPERKKSIGWGVASLATSIVSLGLVIMPYFGLPLSIFALVASSKQKKLGENGLGTAGFIVGIIGIIINSLTLLFLLIGILVLSSMGSL